MSSLSLLDLLPPDSGGDPPPKPKQARRRYRTHAPRGMASRERQASQVRGVLIARLDEWAKADGLAGAERYGLTGDEFLRFYGDMMASLFREEFDDGPPVAYRDAGLIPHGGRLGRVPAGWFGAFAATVGAVYRPPPEKAKAEPPVEIAGLTFAASERAVLDRRRAGLRSAG